MLNVTPGYAVVAKNKGVVNYVWRDVDVYMMVGVKIFYVATNDEYDDGKGLYSGYKHSIVANIDGTISIVI